MKKKLKWGSEEKWAKFGLYKLSFLSLKWKILTRLGLKFKNDKTVKMSLSHFSANKHLKWGKVNPLESDSSPLPLNEP